MKLLRFMPLVLKQVVRHRTRSLLTVLGVMVAMFLFTLITAVHAGVASATTAARDDTTLVVYRQNRYCPFTSRMPESYEARIRRVAGVASVTPMLIVVNNCRAGLDVVTFRGVPVDGIDDVAAALSIETGSVDLWRGRTDGALVSRAIASRRGLRVGDGFNAAGISVTVAGIFSPKRSQDQASCYVHLDFLQRASSGDSAGIVTQFLVTVTDAAQLEAVAERIDETFRHDPEPTMTTPEKAFVARAAADVIEIVSFARLVAWGCLMGVLALVANAMVLSVRDRIREHAVLQTIGYRSVLIGGMIVLESVILAGAGGLVGSGAAMALLGLGQFSLAAEGASIGLHAPVALLPISVGVAVAVGVLAGLFPAWRASRREIAECFRAI
jgi:putative ABC transport system permease protein